MVMSLSHLLPIAVSVYYHDGATQAFTISMAVNFAAGFAMWFSTRNRKDELTSRDGILLVVLAWCGGAAFATLPLLMVIPGLSFTDAYFETMSGLTTTGSTVLSGLDALEPSINFWRCLLVWLGGMGLIVLAVAILPLLGVGGRQIFKAETPGPMKDEKLTPRITETAKGLWVVYAIISMACVFAYRGAGMSWFDATVHMFSTMGLGGFSSHDASFGYWNSPLIEAVAILFMLIASINFGTHFLAVRNRSLRPYRGDPEILWCLGMMLGSCLLVAAYLLFKDTYADFLSALRFASFNVISIATTTGYASTDFNEWPIFAPLWMLFLCSFASCSGSTGGGIKMIRARLLYIQVYREFVRLLHPTAAVPAKLAGHVIDNKVIFAVLAFLFIYIASIVVLTLVMTASGLDVLTAFSAVVASINNMGPGLNEVGPATTYAVLDDFQTWVCTFAMLLGRLELFTVLIVFTPVFWRK
ncbi:MAG: TrkH family potassium uptake protein [Burkholderiales bacterium]|nr:TrkH family potassium uptake protein [Burkholderiales bacterium]